MADWDADDFEPDGFKSNQSTDKWVGEDEDDDVKENWDDEEEEKKETPTETKPVQVKKKRTVKEILKEKEEKKIQEALERAEEKQKLEEQSTELSKEDELAEKLQRQKLVEESDLELAKEAFGAKDDALLGKKSIDELVPGTRQDFLELSDLIVKKLSNYESDVDYEFFLETLFRDLCTSLDTEVVKRLGSTLNVLSSEKLKAQKAKKVKKGGKKATLTGAAKSGRKDDLDAYGDYIDYGGEFDDFM